MNTKLLAITLFLLPLLINGCGSRNTFQPPPPPKVSTGTPEVGDVTVYQKFPGRLEAIESVEIRARVRGFLEEVAFEDGQKVDAGETLFVIEQAPYEAALQSAEAQLAQAKANQSLAESSLERKKRAFANQAVSELDVLSAEADVQAAAAAILAAEAAMQVAKLDLSYATIKAPISGRLSRHYVSAGNLVGGTESTLLALLNSEDPMLCYFSVDERALILFSTGRTNLEEEMKKEKGNTPVKLELADGTILPEEGLIDYADNTFDADTGTLYIRARFDNPQGLLIPGMFGKVMIPVEFEQAMQIPELSIQKDMIGSYVLIVNPDNIVESRYLELGPRNGAQRIIRSGLEKGDQVIVQGLQRARPGIEVQAGPLATESNAAEKDS